MWRFWYRLGTFFVDPQRSCVHWWDVKPVYEEEIATGHFVNTIERMHLRITVEPRVCSKCGLREERRVGEPTPLGWYP